MPAAASAAPSLGVELLLRRRSDRSRAHRRRARPSQPRAPRHRGRDAWRRRKPRRWPRSASRRRARPWSPPPKAGIPGVVGLVAARLKERFGRPAFAIALEPGGIGTGSGRSIPGVDLGRVVRQAVGEGLLIKGGGHAMAAGVTLRKDALAAFRAFLEDDARRGGRGGAARRCAADRRRAHGGGRDRRDHRDASRRRGRSAPAIPSRWWRCRRTRSPMPTRSGRRMCGCGCARATARASMRSRSARSGRSSARR